MGLGQRRIPVLNPSSRSAAHVLAPEGHAAASSGAQLAEAGAVLTIDLGALRSNYRQLRKTAAPAEVAAVVKADAYGLGAAKIAAALMAEGCRTFFVAHLAEGEALRGALGAGPDIFILNGLNPGVERACAEAGLLPVLNSLEQIVGWSSHARRSGSRLPAALQVDSGMSRLGMTPEEVARLRAEPNLLAGVETRLVMSHLACADEPSSPANERQRHRFEALRALLPQAPASLANSSGIHLGPSFQHDLVRPGAALYGINPTPGRPNPMRPVVSLSARVIQTRAIAAGEGIGYGHSAIAASPMRLATIAIGYADGWHRRAAAHGFLGDVPLPFIGRVSMDSIILDVSALPEGEPKRGDLVELIGPHQSVDDVAGHAGTIGYEVLTGLGSRFHRVYLD